MQPRTQQNTPRGARSSLFVSQETGQAIKKVWEALIYTRHVRPDQSVSQAERRLQLLLYERSAPCVLITEGDARANLPALPSALTVLPVDAPARPWDLLSATNPGPTALRVTPSHLAYVIYTSGSTGTPKGVWFRIAQWSSW